MRFVDEAVISVTAGNGGNGCISFRREKYIPFGGPNGGNGGNGGSIYLQADAAINTLINYHYKKLFQAESGQPGEGANKTGRSGRDLRIIVPIGTTVSDANTGELIGDLVKNGQNLLVARGGLRGLGNTRYKSSTNRTPFQLKPGSLGEKRLLHLELKLIADVGLLGRPNSGKSTLLCTLTDACPKVAQYPFTTIYPNLGVVKYSSFKSFTLADIPGLAENATEGYGLGSKFLKHLWRTKIILHIVDISPHSGDPVRDILLVSEELSKYSTNLSIKERWLIMNKIDLVPECDRQALITRILSAIAWKSKWFTISALSFDKTKLLVKELINYLDIIT